MTTTTETYEERVARETREGNEREVRALKPLGLAGRPLEAKLSGTWTATYFDTENPHWPDRREREVRLVQTIGGGWLPIHYTASYVPATQRVVVRVELPEGATHDHVGRDESRPEATFDAARGVPGLVASIKRIAGEARIFVQSVAERKQREDAYEAKVHANGARLAAVLGVKAPRRETRTSDVRLYTHPKSVGSLDAQVYETDVALSIRGVPLALAEKILKLIADAPAKKGD